jgi:hypothetical protein
VRPRAGGIVLGTLMLSMLACQILAGIEIRSESDAGPDSFVVSDAGHEASREDAPRDAKHEASHDATGDRATACQSALPPGPPTSDSSTGEAVTFTTALQSVWYDIATDAGRGLGYNLDDDCTCEGTPMGPPSCVNDSSPNCDGDGGRDYSANILLSQVDAVLGAGRGVAATFDSKIDNGQFTLLLEVGDYNLSDDDEHVILTAYVSGGLVVPDGGTNVPQWNGKDLWTVDPRSTTSYSSTPDGGWEYIPLYVATGYVTHGTLVAQMGTIELGVGQGSIALSDAVFVATIESDFATGSHTLTGQVAGRVDVRTIFSVAATFPDPTIDGSFYCGDDPTFGLIRSFVCGATDIMADAAADNLGLPCDGLSIAVGFKALPVRIGGPQEGIQPVVGCDGSVATCGP